MTDLYSVPYFDSSVDVFNYSRGVQSFTTRNDALNSGLWSDSMLVYQYH